MQTMISFCAKGVPQEDLARVLAEYLALDRARIARRLMVVRFGLLALVAGLLETIVHGFSMFARYFTVALFLFPPCWAWAVELGRARRVARASKALSARA